MYQGGREEKVLDSIELDNVEHSEVLPVLCQAARNGNSLQIPGADHDDFE